MITQPSLSPLNYVPEIHVQFNVFSMAMPDVVWHACSTRNSKGVEDAYWKPGFARSQHFHCEVWKTELSTHETVGKLKLNSHSFGALFKSAHSCQRAGKKINGNHLRHADFHECLQNLGFRPFNIQDTCAGKWSSQFNQLERGSSSILYVAVWVIYSI